jgi:hypothetical protein
MFGERLLAAVVIITIALGCLRNLAVAKAGILDRFRGSRRLGSPFLLLILSMHRKGIVRIWLSLSATAAVLLAVTIVVIEVG